MLIDGVGYDVPAMSKLSEAEFVKTHLDNTAIGSKVPADGREAYLKSVHAQIKEAATKAAAAAAPKAATPPDEKGVAK